MAWPFSNGADTAQLPQSPQPAQSGGMFGLPSFSQLADIGKDFAAHLARTDAALLRIEAAIARLEAAAAPRIEGDVDGR